MVFNLQGRSQLEVDFVPSSGGDRSVDKSAKNVAVFAADFLLRRHHKRDAERGDEIQKCGFKLARHYVANAFHSARSGRLLAERAQGEVRAERRTARLGHQGLKRVLEQKTRRFSQVLLFVKRRAASNSVAGQGAQGRPKTPAQMLRGH
jgi:hypothetical protein